MSEKQNDRSEAPKQPAPEAIPPLQENGSPIIVDGDTVRDEEAIATELRDTHQGTGETSRPQKAVEEGLSYTPPRDPATIPDPDDPQGSQVAAGFASSMEATDPDERILPEHIDDADLEIQEDIGLALSYNSETAHLTRVSPLVHRGVVSLYGTVPTEDDIARVYDIVSDLEGVVRVISHLEVAD